MYSVGLDYHQNRSSLHILDAQGARFKALEVKGAWPTLIQSIDQQVPRPFNICFEASCGYGVLYDQLAKKAASVQVAHPAHLRAIFASKKKTDKLDAAKLAKILYLEVVPKVHVPKSQVRQWRMLIEFRHKLLGRIVAAKSQLRALCRGIGLCDLPRGRKLFTVKALADLAGRAMDPLPALQRDMLLEEFKSLNLRKKQVEQELAKVAAKRPEVQLLMSIPGVGIRTAEAVVAYIDDIRRFGKIAQVPSYFGVIPREDSSANQRHLGHITKDGPGTVRWLLCEAAWQGVQRSPTIRAYFQRIGQEDPDRRKLALVATANYLLRVMAAMLRNGELWRERVPEQEELTPADPGTRTAQAGKESAMGN